jgi:GDPmannose 4,6-dehydratase
LKVLITGVTGQDGAILASKLLAQNFDVSGGFRRGAQNSWRMRELGLTHQVNFVNYDATDTSTIDFLISQNKYDCIYHFAGSSFTLDSLNFPQTTLLTNINGTVSLLEAVRKFSPETQVFIAGSSEIFDKVGLQSNQKVNENSRVAPSNPYGVSHLAIASLVNIYRNEHGLTVVLGVFFNHESKFRSLQFVTRKITHGVAEIKLKSAEPLVLGNFSAKRDWGCAFEFMDGAQRLIESRSNENFVFATGTSSTVRDILNVACLTAEITPEFKVENGLEICIDQGSGKIIASSDSRFFRKSDETPFTGDSSLLFRTIGWHPTRSLSSIISEMTLEDLKRVSRES